MAFHQKCRLNNVQFKNFMEGCRTAMKERKLVMAAVLVDDGGRLVEGVMMKKVEYSMEKCGDSV